MKIDISCDKYRPIHEHSHLQELIDNIPYVVMIFLGAAIFYTGIETSFWRWITAGLCVLYGIFGAFWIIIFVCPYCHYFDTRACPCGYGRIASKLRRRKDDSGT